MSNSGSAPEKELNELHAAVAKKLRDILENGEIVEVAGEHFKRPPSAAMLHVIRSFLRDNNVKCDAGLPTRAVGELGKSMKDTFESLEDHDLPKFN